MPDPVGAKQQTWWVVPALQEKAKQSAAATSELLRQHAVLQQTTAQAAAEVDALRRSEAEASERLAREQAESQRLLADAGR